jgi:hypothetical protein
MKTFQEPMLFTKKPGTRSGLIGEATIGQLIDRDIDSHYDGDGVLEDMRNHLDRLTAIVSMIASELPRDQQKALAEALGGFVEKTNE